MTAAPGPLAGLRVADFSRVVAGPYAAMVLGDLGADVVKVERPGGGDDTRGFGPPFVPDGEGGEVSAYYLAVNRNKRGVAWDLASPEGRERARELALSCDVLIENFRPGTAARLGLSYEELSARHPGLVYCSISGFGSGQGASLPGYDFLVQAVGGLMSVTGPESGDPVKVGVAVVDVLTSLFAVNAVLAALYERERSGRGQRVEVNLLSSCLAALINQASTYLTTGRVPRPMGSRHPSIAPYETLRAKDRPVVVAVGNDAQFAVLAHLLERGWMATDPRFSTNAGRVRNREELVAELEAALAGATAADWAGRLQAAGIPSGLVNDVSEAFSLAERLGLEPLAHLDRDGSKAASAGSPDPAAQVASPIRLSRTPAALRLPPPRLGEHSREVEAMLRHAVEQDPSRAASPGGAPPTSGEHGP